MKHTVKNYLNWLIDLHNNLQPYDIYFIEGKKATCNNLNLGDGVHDYALYYISQLIIINLYEFLNVLHRWKFEQIKEGYKLTDDQFIDKLKSKFDIDYSDMENQQLINKILNSEIFIPVKQPSIVNGNIVNINESLYDSLASGRREIAHADYNPKSDGRINGFNKLIDILGLIEALIK